MKNRLPFKLIQGHTNINLLRNKFDYLKITTGRNIDILWISKTKLDDFFLQPNLNQMGAVLHLCLIEITTRVRF